MAGSRSSASVKQLTLAATILGSGIALLDSTVVNVALPTIQRSLGGGLAGQQWVSNAYLLTLGSLILIGGSLGDLFGERRVFALGVGGFGIASVLCALAPTIGVLIAFRAVQGVASALLTPSSLAVIIATFPEGERGAAIGTWTAFGGVATVIGPLAGGELLSLASWRWIFLINVPLVIACEALILTVIPRRAPGRAAHGVDWVGAALCALGLGGPVFALIEQPRLGWASPGVIVPLVGGLLLLAAFLLYESRARYPMLHLGLFRRPNFSAGNLETFAMYGGLGALFFFLVLFLQQVAGWSPLHSGLATLPVTVVMFALSRHFGRLASRYGPRRFMGGGPLVSGCGLLLLLRLGTHVNYFTDLLPALTLFSLGLSMTVAPLTATVLSGVGTGEAGIASGVNNAIARVAGLLCTAALGAIVAAQFSSALAHHLDGQRLSPAGVTAVAQARHLTLGQPSLHGLPAAEASAISGAASYASLRAFRLGIGVAAALVILGGIIGIAGIRDPRQPVGSVAAPTGDREAAGAGPVADGGGAALGEGVA